MRLKTDRRIGVRLGKAYIGDICRLNASPDVRTR